MIKKNIEDNSVSTNQISNNIHNTNEFIINNNSHCDFNFSNVDINTNNIDDFLVHDYESDITISFWKQCTELRYEVTFVNIVIFIDNKLCFRL